MKNEALLLSEIEDITKDESGVYHTVNKLLAKLDSDNYTDYKNALDSCYENQKKHNKDYTFTNNADTITQKTNPTSKRNKELITITKPKYQNVRELKEYITNELDSVEYELKQLNSEALDESKKRKELGKITKLKDDYFKLSEQLKLVTEYHETVNNSVENTNIVNNNLIQIGKNSAEKRLLFSEMNQLVNSNPIDQDKLNTVVNQYIFLGNESTKLREKIDEINETPKQDYMVVREPSVSVKKQQEPKEPTETKPKKKKIKVKSKGKPKGKMKGGGDKTKSLETVIETIDLLNHESSSDSGSDGEEEPAVEPTVESTVEPDVKSTVEPETKKLVITNESETNLDAKSGDFDSLNDEELEEVDLTGGGGKDSKTNSFQIDTLDLDDDLESLANYSDDSDSDGENTTQNVDFTNTYNSDSADNLDTAESIPLGIDMNKVQNSQENIEEQTVNVIKLGS